jgi:hypothetical protein
MKTVSQKCDKKQLAILKVCEIDKYTLRMQEIRALPMLSAFSLHWSKLFMNKPFALQ